MGRDAKMTGIVKREEWEIFEKYLYKQINLEKNNNIFKIKDCVICAPWFIYISSIFHLNA